MADKLSDLLSTLGVQESDELFAIYNEEEYNQLIAAAEALEQRLEDARNAVSRADAQMGALIDQTVIYSGAWDELQEALAQQEE